LYKKALLVNKLLCFNFYQFINVFLFSTYSCRGGGGGGENIKKIKKNLLMKKPTLEWKDFHAFLIYWAGLFLGRTIFKKETSDPIVYPPLFMQEILECNLITLSCILLEKTLIPFQYRRGKFREIYFLGSWLKVKKLVKITSFQALMGRFYLSWTSSSPFETFFSPAFFLGVLGFLAEIYLMKVGLTLFLTPGWKAVKKKKKSFFVSDNPDMATSGFYAGVSCFFLLCVWYETFQKARRCLVAFGISFGKKRTKDTTRGARETLKEEEEYRY